MRWLILTVPILGIALAIVALGGRRGSSFICIHYPDVQANEPITNPEVIAARGENTLTLKSGTIVLLTQSLAELEKQGRFNLKVGDEVALDALGVDSVYLKAREHGFICGTPWVALITIPLIPDRVYKNRVRHICEGTIVPPDNH